MDIKKCFESGCEIEVEYSCQCTSPETLFCEQHFVKHYKIPNRDHKVESIYIEPFQGTKEAILDFLTKEKSKHNKLKRNIAATFTQRLFDSERDIKELLKNLDSYSAEINNCFTKISQIKKLSKQEQDPILGLLSLQPEEAVEKVKNSIPANTDWYNSAKAFCGFSEKIEKLIECFIKDKFEGYIDKRLDNIEKSLDKHDKLINLNKEENNMAFSTINNELTRVKNSVQNLINENKKSKKILEDWKKSLNLKIENEASLVNSQIIKITEDLDRELQKKANDQNSEKNNVLTAHELREKMLEILNNTNDSEIEQDFRITCSIYDNEVIVYDLPLKQSYQDYVDAYNRQTSLYCIYAIKGYKNSKSNLFIYDTESTRQETKVLEAPELLENCKCIAQIPNGKLFCFCGDYYSYLIDNKTLGVQKLPLGVLNNVSSAIYFNRIVYCIGSKNIGGYCLDANRWVNLIPMEGADQCFSSVICRGNILISGFKNRNILRYSINGNILSTINFQFAADTRKILLSAERLYLIECYNGSIYESRNLSGTDWRQIGASIINDFCSQIYSSYNKGSVNIACLNQNGIISCYKFNLNEKSLTGLV